MAFPNLGQPAASTRIGLPSMKPKLPKGLGVKPPKKVNAPQMARSSLLAGMKGC